MGGGIEFITCYIYIYVISNKTAAKRVKKYQKYNGKTLLYSQKLKVTTFCCL